MAFVEEAAGPVGVPGDDLPDGRAVVQEEVAPVAVAGQQPVEPVRPWWRVQPDG